MKLTHLIIVCVAIVVAIASYLNTYLNIEKTVPDMMNKMSAPIAKKVPYEMEIHGHKRVDDYYWMRDDERKDTEVLAHLEAENKYLKSVMAHTENFQKNLYDEIVGRIKKDDNSVPLFVRGYWYQSKFDAENEYPVHVRRKETEKTEEVLFDVNQMASEHDYFNLSGYSISPNNDLAAYGTDIVSRRIYTMKIKELISGKILDDTIESTEGHAIWANDGQHLFYIKKDLQTLLGNRVYRHKLGTDQSEDTLVYEEDDDSFYMSLGKSRDHSVLYIYHESTTKSGVSVLDANDPLGAFALFHALEDDHEYIVEKLDEYYYIYTNWDAKNFRLMKVHQDQTTDKNNWQDVVAHRPGVYISDFTIFENALVVKEKENGQNRIAITDLKGENEAFLSFDDPVFNVSISNNPEVSSRNVRLNYSSVTTPNTVYEFDLKSGKRKTLKQDKILGGFDPANYQSERIFIDARDGAKVPVSIVYHKDKFNKDSTNPIFQYAYGSYGITIEPSFNAARLSLLDRGVVYVIAHIRGSQMLGRPWYEDGKLFNKMNSFTDFIDVTKGLVAEKYGHKEKVYAMGGSAGGLLMGGILNMAPELYLGVGAHVPFVDVMTTMLDTSIPLTTNEYDQWGNPNIKEYYDYMLSYSPYDQLEKKDYPHILVTTGLHDSQVQYFEPMKWVAKLRDYKTDDNRLVFETDMEAGHGGASGRFKRYKQTALEYAFYFDLLGIKE
ncbi:MAG: S9 family peptidase [Kordiimonadaceae bacterium]|nr:S9 family peptidase [Kordiimonadaceae bacterium]